MSILVAGFRADSLTAVQSVQAKRENPYWSFRVPQLPTLSSPDSQYSRLADSNPSHERRGCPLGTASIAYTASTPGKA